MNALLRMLATLFSLQDHQIQATQNMNEQKWLIIFYLIKYKIVFYFSNYSIVSSIIYCSQDNSLKEQNSIKKN